MWSFEISVLYNCVYFPFILAKSLMMAILAEICFWLYNKQNKFVVLYAFFWVIPQRLNFICQCFGTLCLFHLHRQIGMKNSYPPMKMEQSVPKRRHIKFMGNYPEESMQHSEHGEALKSRFNIHGSVHCSMNQ
jgi:hypothetical protein